MADRLTVTMPLALPALIGGFILAFLHSLSLVRRAGHFGLAGGNPHDHHADLGAVSISAAPGYRRGVFSAAALGDDGIDRRAKENSRAARFQHRRRQGRPEALDPLWLGACTGAASGARHSVAVGLFASLDFIESGAVQRLGDAPDLGQFHLEEFFLRLFEYGDTQRAIYNTFKLGILTATIGTLVATLIAYITNRNLFRGARYLTFFALAPLVIPGIVLAVGLFIAYTRPPLVLYGTIWILFVAYLTKEMPIGFSQAESTFKSIHPELEDASRIIGANRLLSLKDVTVPLARVGADRRLVVHLHRGDPGAQRLDSALCASLKGGLRGDLRSPRRKGRSG